MIRGADGDGDEVVIADRRPFRESGGEHTVGESLLQPTAAEKG